MAITPTTLALAAQTKAHTTAIVDAYTRDIIRAWAMAWDDLVAEFDRELRYLMALDRQLDAMDTERIRQLQRSLSDVIDTRLAHLINETGAQVGSTNRRIINQTISGQHAIIASQLPPSHRPGFIRTVPQQTLDWIAHRTTQQITVRNYHLAAEATQAMKRELFAGLAIGDNPNKVAERMLERVEGPFNGGLTRATVIARTEMLDVSRAAALESRTANSDVLEGWIWQAALTERTCPACWAMHGTMHPTEEPGPIDHHQGRCTALPATKSWAVLWEEMGLDGTPPPEPDGIRPAPDEAAKKFAGLTEAQQRDILGTKRYDAWQAGAYPMNAWPQRREHWETVDGVTRKAWRDSIHTSNPPKPPEGGWLAKDSDDPVKSWLSSLPSLDRPDSLAEATYWANRGASDGNQSPAAYCNNCHQVVFAMEMRARGYDVTASPTIRSLGRTADSFAADWVDGSGNVRRATLDAKSRSAKAFLERETKSWPDGARGYISGMWKSGGGHVYNIEKTPDGLKFYEGQQPIEADGHLARMRPSRVRILRVDDLHPSLMTSTPPR